jgi:hypothetical protein
MLAALPEQVASRFLSHRLQQIQLLIEKFGSPPDSGFCNLGQPLGAMPPCIDGRTATRNGPAAIKSLDPSHHSADILRERPVAAAQFFQGAQSVLSVIHRLSCPPRNSSASFRASIRSLLLPSFNRAFLRGSQTTTWLT